MKVAIGSDHAGYMLKEKLRNWLIEVGNEVVDFGTFDEERCDYPHFGAMVGLAVASGEVEIGVVVCGSGQGICIAANKVSGVRGGVIRNNADAEMTRRHNNANVASFGQQYTDPTTAIEALRVFLTTTFDGGRHQARIEMLSRLDESRGVSEV
jgi:ribose 5-phosphate isomerase B